MIYVYGFVAAAVVLFVVGLVAMRGHIRAGERADFARLDVPLAPPRADLTGSPRHGSEDTADDIGHIPRHLQPDAPAPVRVPFIPPTVIWPTGLVTPAETIGSRAIRVHFGDPSITAEIARFYDEEAARVA